MEVFTFTVGTVGIFMLTGGTSETKLSIPWALSKELTRHA